MPARDVPGLLLINLGTPRAPRAQEVRRYLREFLSDPRVLDMPAPLRWLVLELGILPFRPRRSAEQYAKIWTEQGSPLLVLSRALAEKVRQRLGDSAVVQLAPR
jgi:ferrochelatase